jgi:hypothetical protein
MTTGEVKRLILRDVKGWRGVFGLDEWTLHLRYDRLDDEMVASCMALWQYREATLTFDLEQIVDRELGRGAIRKTVLHELLHVVCCGYQRHHKREQLEAMVTDLERIVEHCWKAPQPKDS